MTRPLYVEVLELSMPDWWNRVEDSEDFRVYSNYGLGAAYSLIALVALIQLVRIQVRVPEYGWTTQKVFHLLNCVVSSMRAGTFFFGHLLLTPSPTFWQQALLGILMDLPGLLFFTTYTLLVLFWAEIYHQARSMPTGQLRPVFIILNVVAYAVQGTFWALAKYPKGSHSASILIEVGRLGSNWFLAAVSLAAALGFLLYGGRLFLMLQRFPIESRGRRKKLREVGLVTTICAGCFTLRALMLASAALDGADFELDLVEHALPNLLYYALVEVIPSACVLYILRKLPPKRSAQGYQQIPTQ